MKASARTTTKTAAARPIKSMDPRAPDQKYMGSEPEWITQPVPEQRRVALIGALNWYNYYYSKKEGREIVIDWLARQGRDAESRDIQRANEHVDFATAGWLCRMQLRGWHLAENEQQHIEEVVSRHRALVNQGRVVKVSTEPERPRVTIQDRLRDIMITAAGDLEGMYDDLIAADSRLTADYKPMAVLRGHNVAPALIREIRDVWTARRERLDEITAGRDSQLVEGYSNFTKTQIKNLVKFVDLVIADCDSYVQVKKTERAPRKKKPVSPERLTQRFAHLREFAELKLKSEPVTKLVNATEAWLYDTKKRRLIHVMADSHVGSFTVKGTAIIGFDAVQTLQKTLRKPAEQLRDFLAQSVPNARKWFRDLKATDTKYNGRGNENLVILKVK